MQGHSAPAKLKDKNLDYLDVKDMLSELGQKDHRERQYLFIFKMEEWEGMVRLLKRETGNHFSMQPPHLLGHKWYH